MHVYGCIYCCRLHAGVSRFLFLFLYMCFVNLWREHLSKGGQLDRSGGAKVAEPGVEPTTSWVKAWGPNH